MSRPDLFDTPLIAGLEYREELIERRPKSRR